MEQQIDQMARPGAVAIRSGNLKAVFLGLVSIIFVAGGIWMIVDGPTGIRIIGSLNVVVFGLAFARFAYLIFNPKPSLVVDHDGVYDNGSTIAAGFIPWSEIKGIYIPRFTAQAFIGIYVKDVETIYNRLPVWKTRLIRLNSGLTGTAINVPVGMLRIGRNELIALLREKHSEIRILPEDANH
jgi:hypothetical protein